MTRQYLNPAELFSSLPHGFSQGVAASGHRIIHLSGQTAWRPDRTLVGGADLGEQARQALRNVDVALRSAGAGLRDIVSLRIYVVNYQPDSAPVLSAVLNEFFPGAQKPASTWLGVAALANPDFLVEIEAIAVLQ